MVSVQGGKPIDYEEILSIVSLRMRVTDYYARRDDSALEFSMEDSPTLKRDFVQLIHDLKPYGMVAALRRINDQGLVVNVGSEPVRRSRLRWWMPLVLFAVTVGVVLYDGLIRSQTMSAQTYITDPWEMAMIYTLSLMGILGIHELGHIIAAKRHKLKATWPFFIPGVPGFFVNPPTFGAVIFSRGHMINRDMLFDVGVSGPIAGLVVTVIVSIYGAMISPLMPAAEAGALLEQGGLLNMPTSLLMLGSFFVAGKVVDGFVPVMSPVAFAAWIGFLLTFLNLLPAWQLDGGHISRAAIGQRWHRRLTFASVVVLAGLGYIVMALFILMMSSRTRDLKPLDDVSPLSRKRRMIFIASLVLAFLCAPLQLPI